MNFRSLRADVRALNAAACACEEEYGELIARLPGSARASGLNLAAYLALRRAGKKLRESLGALGLALAGNPVAIWADLNTLGSLSGDGIFRAQTPCGVPSRREGERLLLRRTVAALGPAASLARAPAAHARSARARFVQARAARIMVTAPDDAAEHPGVLRALLAEGMTALRINCARGNAEDWRRVVARLREAEKRTGKRCRVMMDLAGPKVRTSAVESLRAKPPVVTAGDRFLLVSGNPGERAPRATQRGCAAAVTTTVPSALADLRTGERVLIDDGKIAARVGKRGAGWVELVVEQARAKGQKIRPERSLNFPDSSLRLSGLSGKDREDVAVAAALADMVGLSFVKDPSHVAEARELLSRMNADRVALVLKVENRAAVERLDLLLFETLCARNSAVLIARGDLAAECGFESLGGIQRTVADMAHAAHIPVILATQVLERMVKTGLPSRAEIGDLAFSSDIECRLLNKGPFVREATRFLRGWHARAGESVSP